MAAWKADTYSGMDKLGIEPLDAKLNAEYLKLHFGKRKKAIKMCLLDQNIIAGIGNIYSDEILFTAKINPARPACTLSGGESFLVSLSLALGLSSLSRQSLSVDTLFIDEGFGTLSSDYLNTVMDTLEKLHQMGGKKVGIISHVEGLKERIKTQIQVRRIDSSRSEIEVVNTL